MTLEPCDIASPETVDRREGPHGEIVLRRRGGRYEIIANGCFLMDTSDGRSERLLVSAALDTLNGRNRPSVLIGGLGVGFSLAEAAGQPRWGRITVVEREQAVIDWHRTEPGPRPSSGTDGGARGRLAAFSGGALGDPRVRVVHADLLDHLASDGQDRYDAVCLDVDNGPDWTVSEGNAGLYGDRGLALLHRRIAPGGVLAVWSAQASPAFEQRLGKRFSQVRTLRVPVPRGEPDLVHLAGKAP